MEEYVDERFEGLSRIENKYVGERSGYVNMFMIPYRHGFIDLGNDSGKDAIDQIFNALADYMKETHIPPNQRQIVNMLKKHDRHIFCWDDVPGNDSVRLIKFLDEKMSVEWAKDAEIKKPEDGKTIDLSDGTNLVLLRLNEVKTKVTLRINNAETNKFIVKKKRGKLSIYYVYYNP
ncbi:MAG: hypothetical protein U9O85_00485 [Euryarchaeota archaeon]|nr:hypothetical protein [Euryarchaeota archaeon]